MGWGQSSRSKSGRWKKLWRFLGVRRRKERTQALLWFLVVCTAMGGLTVSTVYAGMQYEQGRRERSDTKQAITLANRQIAALGTAKGLAPGRQCFDIQGTPRSATDPDAPCSYYPNGVASGCLSYWSGPCYMVRIVPDKLQGPVADKLIDVTYRVKVSWGKTNSLEVAYRMAQSNPAYNVNLVHDGAANLLEGKSQTVQSSLKTTTGQAITKLSDISGGPSVSVSIPECKPGTSCYGAAGRYNLVDAFTIGTNVPSKLITGCSWNFGDDSGIVTVMDGSGCGDGQTIQHDYHTDWQLQNIPPFPDACFAPLGSGVDTHIFLVTVTLHTTEGVDVASKAPVLTILPSCTT